MVVRRVLGAGTVCLIGLLLSITIASTAFGSTLKLCVPKAEGSSLLTPKRGKCRKGYTLTSFGGEGKEGRAGTTGPAGPTGTTGPEGKAGTNGNTGTSGKTGNPGPKGETGPEGPSGTSGFTSPELETLKRILPYISLVSSGIDDRPTVQFSGVNVQIVNGEGSTASKNGAGNLVIGYDENPRVQTGSHNLVLGGDQEYTSFGALLGGFKNSASGEYTDVLGEENTASGPGSSVTGGGDNRATSQESAVSGGFENTASGEDSSISGGETNTTSGEQAWIGGGRENEAAFKFSSVFGSRREKTKAEYEAIP